MEISQNLNARECYNSRLGRKLRRDEKVLALEIGKEKPVELIKVIRNLGRPYKPKKMTHVSVKVVNSTVRMFSTVLTPFLCRNMEYLEGVNISHLHY